MSFLTIGALAIALLVAAPIAAHLLRRRQAEERPFPPARLLPATPPTARRRSMLEDRALFGVRALAVVLLAVLGATPFVRCSRLSLSRKGGASVALAIVIDDSLSMRAPMEGGKESRFERALGAARELSRGLQSGDAVAIVLGGAPARVALGSTTNMSAVEAALDGLEPSDRATDLDGALGVARSLLRGLAQRDKRVVLLSDLADGAPGAALLAGEDEIALWVPLPELVASGSDCAVTRADRAGAKVWARVVCTSAEASSAPSGTTAAAASAVASASSASAGRELLIRSGEKVIAKAKLDAAIRMEEIAVELPADAPEVLRAALTPGDAIAEDDEAPVVVAGGALPMAVVVDAASNQVATGGPPPIEQAFTALDLDAQVRPLPAVPEHEAELNAFAAMIVDDAPGFTPEVRRAIAAWVERGGVALLTLGPRAAAAPLGAGFEPLLPGVIRWGDSPAEGIDVVSAPSFGPSAPSFAKLHPRGRAALDKEAAEGAEVLARWSDGAPFLLRRSLGRGAVLVLTLPLGTSESDLALRPAFLALLDRFVRTARARGGARRIEVGEAWTFDGYRDVKVVRAPVSAGEKGRSVAVTESEGRLRAAPPLAGLYALELDGEQAKRVAAVPDREVDLRARGVREDARAGSLGGMATSMDVSPYVALLLLALCAGELCLRSLGQREEGLGASG